MKPSDESEERATQRLKFALPLQEALNAAVEEKQKLENRLEELEGRVEEVEKKISE